MIAASAAGTCAGFVILGFAPTLAVVFAGRALLGSFGVGIATAQAWVADTTPPEDRGRVMGLVSAFGGLGFVFGPAIGALGILLGGMRLPFFVSAACAAGNAVLAGTLPAGRGPGRGGGPYPRAWGLAADRAMPGRRVRAHLRVLEHRGDLRHVHPGGAGLGPRS